MSPRVLVLVLALALGAGAGCERTNHVELLLGPDTSSLSNGYACIADDNSLMARRAFVPDPGTPLVGALEFQFVVDFIALGGGVPGCRGEEIATWCADHACAPLPGRRACSEVRLDDVDFTAVDFTDPDVARGQLRAIVAARIPEIYAQLGATPITEDAPDDYVILRGVATTEPCADVLAMPGGSYAPFDLSDGDGARFVGCASSCPVRLDDVDAAIGLSIDATDNRCEPEALRCAGTLSASDASAAAP